MEKIGSECNFPSAEVESSRVALLLQRGRAMLRVCQ